MFIASVCPSVRLSVCLKPKFGRLKTKFDDDAEGSAKRTRVPEKLSLAPRSMSSVLYFGWIHTHTCKQIPLGLRKRLSILRTIHDCSCMITCYTLHTLLAHL